MKCRKENFFWRGRMRIFLRPKATNGTEEEAKTVPQNEENGRQLGDVEVVEKKLVTHFEKIMCRVHEFA